jgi:hypothetical protein
MKLALEHASGHRIGDFTIDGQSPHGWLCRQPRDGAQRNPG